MDNLLTRDEVIKYDELMLFNDTFYGPIYPFDEVFERMENSKIDIWGLSIHGKAIINNKKKESHIQSYFIIINKNVLRKDAFWNFWRELKVSQNFDDAVENFEIAFSDAMRKAGFSLGAYLDIPKYQSNNYENNFDYCQLNPYECICKYRFPIFKKKNLINAIPTNMESRLAMDFIQHNTDYPVSLIWQDELRKNRLPSIQLGMGFDQVLPSHLVAANGIKACIIVNITSDDFYKEICDYLSNLSEECSLYAFVNSNFQDEFKLFENKLFHRVYYTNENFWQNMVSHADEFLTYDYIGICSDKKFTEKDDPKTRKYARRFMMDGCFMNKTAVEEIIAFFLDNDRLGICLPQECSFEYWEQIVNESLGDRLMHYANSHNISNMISEYEPLFCGNDSFWIRKAALNFILSDYDNEFDDIWSKIIPLLIQAKGFYPCVVSQANRASSLIADYKRELWNVSEELKALKGAHHQAIEILEQERDNWEQEKIKAQSEKIKLERELQLIGLISSHAFCKLYIYGCGKVGNYYSSLLERYNINITGYIVSDGEKHDESFHDHPVYELSQFSHDETTVVLVGVGNKNKPEVINLLKQHNIKNVLSIV